MLAADAEVTRAIEALSDEFARSFNTGNIARLVEGFYAEDAHLLPLNHPNDHWPVADP